MKVGVFLGRYSPQIGGGYTFQDEICRAIEKWGPASGHEFVIFTFSQEAAAEWPAVAERVKIIPVTTSNYKSHFFMLCRSAVSFLAGAAYRRTNLNAFNKIADPVSAHIREQSIDITWSLTPACYSTEVPNVLTVWDLQHRFQPFFPEVSMKDEWAAREKAYSSSLRRAAYIITGTETGKREIEKFYQVPGERIIILPFPTPSFVSPSDGVADEMLLRKYQLPDRFLFYPAQFWPHKNHYGVLKGLQKLRDKHGARLPVVFVGSDMGNLTYIRRIASDLQLTEQVYFLGFVPRDHLEALYRRAYCLLFLSFFGPDNLPPLEAFAAGCPVIASNIPGALEQLGDAALLVDPKDPEKIADTIILLWEDDRLRQTLIGRGLERARTWDGEKYFKGVCAIFDQFEDIRLTWSNTEPFQIVR